MPAKNPSVQLSPALAPLPRHPASRRLGRRAWFHHSRPQEGFTSSLPTHQPPWQGSCSHHETQSSLSSPQHFSSGPQPTSKLGGNLPQSQLPHCKARHPAEQGPGRVHISFANDSSNDIRPGSRQDLLGNLPCCLVYRSILSSTLTHCRNSKEPFIP